MLVKSQNIEMEGETQFVYSHTEILLHNIWQRIPLRKDSSCSTQNISAPKFSDVFARLNVQDLDQEHRLTLQNHELLAIRNEIDDDIWPGFRYKVRELGTDKKLFGGEAKYLENIGQGYGKRLTFESDEILENENFFWTDSNEDGYAFAIEAISTGDVFATKIGNSLVGFAKITKVDEDQHIVSSEALVDGVVKRVKADFECQMTEKFREEDFNGKLRLRLQGIVTSVKGKFDQKCKIQDVRIVSRSGTTVLLQPVSFN